MTPKHKSTDQHKADGTFRADRHTRRPEKTLTALPAPPAWLTKRAKEKWRDVGAQLVAAGHLTELDLDALATYCESWSAWRTALDRLAKDGQVVKGRDGSLKKHPSQQIAETAFKTLAGLQERLGLTPIGRQRMRLDAASEEKDQLTEFMES